MNVNGRRNITEALFDGRHKGDLAVSVSPIIWSPDVQSDHVEVFVRHTTRGKDPTPTALSALAHAGLLHITDDISAQFCNGNVPQLELIEEVEDSGLLHGDKRLIFIDRAVVSS